MNSFQTVIVVAVLALGLSSCDKEMNLDELIYGGESNQKTWTIRDFYLNGQALILNSEVKLKEGDSLKHITATDIDLRNLESISKKLSFTNNELIQSEFSVWESRMSTDPSGDPFDVLEFKYPETVYDWDLNGRRINFDLQDKNINYGDNQELHIFFPTDHLDIVFIQEDEMLLSFEFEETFSSGSVWVNPGTYSYQCQLLFQSN